MRTKAIVLAGGSATRLHPLTKVVSKHLLPVGKHPMISYPLGLLKAAGFYDILLIASPEHVQAYESLLGDGSDHGLLMNYAVQEVPNGIAEALIIGEDFLRGESCALALGDNLFYGNRMEKQLAWFKDNAAPRVFTVMHPIPQNYGVAFVHPETGIVMDVTEKPETPLVNTILTGLYLLNSDAPEIARNLKPSDRGELEIVDLLDHYVQQGTLEATMVSGHWADLGTFEDLHKANIAITQYSQTTPTLRF